MKLRNIFLIVWVPSGNVLLGFSVSLYLLPRLDTWRKESILSILSPEQLFLLLIETKTTKKLATAGKHSSINKVFFEWHTHGLIGRDSALIQMSCLNVSLSQCLNCQYSTGQSEVTSLPNGPRKDIYKELNSVYLVTNSQELAHLAFKCF